MTSSGSPYTRHCAACARAFEHGPHVYGNYIRGWDVFLCSYCKPSIWDKTIGLSSFLKARLKEKNIVPAFDADGLVIIPDE
jgi:hypothetical protein